MQRLRRQIAMWLGVVDAIWFTVGSTFSRELRNAARDCFFILELQDFAGESVPRSTYPLGCLPFMLGHSSAKLRTSSDVFCWGKFSKGDIPPE